MDTQATPKITTNLSFTQSEFDVIQRLKAAGYSFPYGSYTNIGVMRQSLRDAWKIQFPDEPFPGDEDGS